MQKTFYKTYTTETDYDQFKIGNKLNNDENNLYLGDKKLAFDEDIPENYTSDIVLMASSMSISDVTVYSSGATLTTALSALTSDVADIERVTSESISEIYENYITGITINDGDEIEKFNGAVNLNITNILSGGTQINELELNDILGNSTAIYNNGGTNPLICISYGDLYDLYTSEKLTPGAQYLIYDYTTTTSASYTQAAGNNFGLIVVADDEKTINAKARACLNNTTRILYTDLNGENHTLQRDSDSDTTVSMGVQLEQKRITYSLFGFKDIHTDELYYTKDSYSSSTFYTSAVTTNSYTVATSDASVKSFEKYLVQTISVQNLIGTESDYFSSSDLSKWEIWYDIENDTGKYNWADPTNGKGVIYRMIDEFGNDCPYDFKNIKFGRTYDSGTTMYSDIASTTNNTGIKYCFTFSTVVTSASTSVSEDKSNGSDTIKDNIIKTYKKGREITLNNIVFFGNDCYSNTFGNDCQLNTFGNNCGGNTFGNSCYKNMLGNSCVYNTFGNGCQLNAFGNYCNGNTFGTDCDYNTFGNDCQLNTFGNYCGGNTFGNGCCSNTFGTDCNSNTFGNNCEENTFGNGCQLNTFGNNCEENTFGNDCQLNTFELSVNNIKFVTNSENLSPADYFYYNKICSGNMYINIIPYDSSVLNSGTPIKNIIIDQGVNYSTTTKNIQLKSTDVNTTYTIEYKANNSEERII